MKKQTLVVCAIVAFLMTLVLPSPAHGDGLSIQLNATYWILAGNDQDTGSTKCCSTVTDMVLSQLGPDGLPLVNPKYFADGSIQDVNSNGEITWWSPAFNPDVSFLGTGTASIPFSSTEFPPNGNDFNGFLVAEFQGNFTLPIAAKMTIAIRADDDAFLYIDGRLAVGNGGVKDGDTVSGVDSLNAGKHSLTLFYADRDPVRASLDVGDAVTPAPTPEPATLSLFGIGLLGIAAAMRATRGGQ